MKLLCLLAATFSAKTGNTWSGYFEFYLCIGCDFKISSQLWQISILPTLILLSKSVNSVLSFRHTIWWNYVKLKLIHRSKLNYGSSGKDENAESVKTLDLLGSPPWCNNSLLNEKNVTLIKYNILHPQDHPSPQSSERYKLNSHYCLFGLIDLNLIKDFASHAKSHKQSSKIICLKLRDIRSSSLRTVVLTLTGKLFELWHWSLPLLPL